eukprot:881967-Rhodomonas_salina.1
MAKIIDIVRPKAKVQLKFHCEIKREKAKFLCCYAMSGTDLRVCYFGIYGTELGYAAIFSGLCCYNITDLDNATAVGAAGKVETKDAIYGMPPDAPTRCPSAKVDSFIVLCACYAMSGTDLPHGATSSLCTAVPRKSARCPCFQVTCAISLRACYARPSTGIAYGATRVLRSV